tara:strand:+ start:73 stop:345 length:273 start_codon:yes stop_codon:yes gene_type:complete
MGAAALANASLAVPSLPAAAAAANPFTVDSAPPPLAPMAPPGGGLAAAPPGLKPLAPVGGASGGGGLAPIGGALAPIGGPKPLAPLQPLR